MKIPAQSTSSLRSAYHAVKVRGQPDIITVSTRTTAFADGAGIRSWGSKALKNDLNDLTSTPMQESGIGRKVHSPSPELRPWPSGNRYAIKTHSPREQLLLQESANH